MTESRWLPGSGCEGNWEVAASRVSFWNDKNSVLVIELCEHTKTSESYTSKEVNFKVCELSQKAVMKMFLNEK